MSEQTKIPWCDSTVNFWRGCDKVSAGCANCYITTTTPFRVSGQKHGDPRLHGAGAVKLALALNRRPWICDRCGTALASTMADGTFELCLECLNKHGDSQLHRRRIFSLSLGDWLDDKVPVEWLAEMLDTIRLCDQVTWILCTKRPGLWRRRMDAVMKAPCLEIQYNWLHSWVYGAPPKNVITLASVENQAMLEKRRKELLAVPSARRGFSFEPLLSEIVVPDWAGISWAIIGGESGDKARPCNVAWIRSLAQQAQAAHVPTFVKQMGAHCITDNANMDDWPDEVPIEVNDMQGFAAGRIGLKHAKGGDTSEWPDELIVRQFPAL